MSSPVKLQGGALDFGCVIGGVDVDLGYKQLTAKSSDWYQSRSDVTLAFGPRFSVIPWLIPSVGFYSLTQRSDRSVVDAPVAFIAKTSAFTLGIRAEGMPLTVGDGGMLVRVKLDYLTSGEVRANFGTLMGAGLGYGVKEGTFEFGVVFGIERTFLNASTNTSAVNRSVRSVLQGNVLTLFLAY